MGFAGTTGDRSDVRVEVGREGVVSLGVDLLAGGVLSVGGWDVVIPVSQLIPGVGL